MIKKTVFTALIISCALSLSAGKAAPTWLLTVPTAEVLPKDQLNIGIMHLDLGISGNIEAGLHGLKYSISNPDGSKLAFGASLFSGLYPYAVYTNNYDFGRLSLGLTIFPYFIFAGLEKQLTPEISLLAELHNGAAVGVRNKLAKDWVLDFGAGFSAYSYKNLFFVDYANTDYYSFKFPANFSVFMVLALCYSFNIREEPLSSVKPGDKLNPADPVK